MTPIASLRRQLEDDGYAIVRGILGDDVLAPIRRQLDTIVDEQARTWLAEGRITDLCAQAPFERRYAELRRQLPAKFSNTWRRVAVAPALFDLWVYPPLLDLARAVVGDEVYAHGIWSARPRAPHQPVMKIVWHQDAHYYERWSLADGPMLTCWIPLVPVNEASGCMQVLRGSHRLGYVAPVRQADNQQSVPPGVVTKFIEDGAEPVSCDMQPGDVLFFIATTLHQSLDNVSDIVRWSIDIRYCQTSVGLAKGNAGFVCASTDPGAVETYDDWAARYADGTDRHEVDRDVVDATAAQLGVSASELSEY